ncbi:hypothetical protein COU53_03320 [Candidatus Pacearchaeota archaeon CG10_big_fil_rev_8_21_14_0_10_30_48]|nr:MAG: hypothetical protein COU53_03320 [Candidatus Pacearchaeota archaeon CG10_big_fil_rev_8_21_14_0_10_30_48]
MNSKGQMEAGKVIGGIIGLIVLILVVGLIANFDLVGKLKIILPSFGNESSNDNGKDMYYQIFLDDENGRCKPVEGLYSLNNEKGIEVWEKNKWISVESQVPNEDAIRNREVRDELIKVMKESFLEYGGKEYGVEIISLGLQSTLDDGNTYVYVDRNTLLKRNVEGDSISVSPLLPDSLDLWNENQEKEYRNILSAFRNYLSTLTIISKEENFKLELEKLGVSRLYVTINNEIYGIDSSNNFYQKIGTTWQEIPKEDIATNLELNLFNKKQELIEGCGNG